MRIEYPKIQNCEIRDMRVEYPRKRIVRQEKCGLNVEYPRKQDCKIREMRFEYPRKT
jgi:hypothetical protein